MKQGSRRKEEKGNRISEKRRGNIGTGPGQARPGSPDTIDTIDTIAGQADHGLHRLSLN